MRAGESGSLPRLSEGKREDSEVEAVVFCSEREGAVEQLRREAEVGCLRAAQTARRARAVARQEWHTQRVAIEEEDVIMR